MARVRGQRWCLPRAGDGILAGGGAKVWPFGGSKRDSALRRAKRAIRSGKWDEAEGALREFLAQHPERAEARLNLGVVLYRMGRFSEALEELEAVVRAAPEMAEGWLNLAAVANELGLLEKARHALERAEKCRSDMPGLHYNLAILRMKEGKLAEAMAELETELSINPRNSAAISLARALERRLLHRER